MKKIVITFITLFFLLSCDSTKQANNEDYRIGIATFSHETCTFCPRPTGIDEFEYYGPPLEGDEVLNADSYIRGFVDRIHEYGGVGLEGITSPRGAVGGSSGSWITKEAFDKYTGAMQEDIRTNGPYDGIYLSLHGAMAVRGIPKPEAEIVRRIREVGGDIPIIVSLDLHANEDHELSDAASGVIIIKRYPHYDTYTQGERAARLMINTLRGDYKPVMVTRKPGVISPSVYQGTGVSPAMEIMERARRWEDRIPGIYVSVAFGFAYADVPDVGATVMVITNDDKELAERIANDMNDYIWRVRHEFAGKKLPKTAEGVRLSIEAAKEGKTPVVIADHSDRTGNSTHILAELIKQGAEKFCIATIADKKLIEKMKESDRKAGDNVNIIVGGYADEYAGEPVEIKGTLEYFDSYGRFDKVAVVRFGKNNTVIITPELHQVTSAGIIDDLGMNIDNIDIISLKSRVHFRRGFYENGLAGAIFEVDAPGLGPADLTIIEYENIPKDIYPVYEKE
ncbi:MAG: M81 family metallopeptidase [Bacteroidota bacterium]|nr:M81 family metallopeptidase [Bacteroidota bacterium]